LQRVNQKLSDICQNRAKYKKAPSLGAFI